MREESDCQRGGGEHLANVRWSACTVKAIRPVLADWVERRRFGIFSYRLVQVLTGLHEKVGREVTTKCQHCPEARDTAQHSLEVCPAWGDKRRALADKIGAGLDLPTMVGRMLASADE